MASRRQLFVVRTLDVTAILFEFAQKVANSAIFTLFMLVVILMIDGTYIGIRQVSNEYARYIFGFNTVLFVILGLSIVDSIVERFLGFELPDIFKSGPRPMTTLANITALYIFRDAYESIMRDTAHIEQRPSTAMTMILVMFVFSLLFGLALSAIRKRLYTKHFEHLSVIAKTTVLEPVPKTLVGYKCYFAKFTQEVAQAQKLEQNEAPKTKFDEDFDKAMEVLKQSKIFKRKKH